MGSNLYLSAGVTRFLFRTQRAQQDTELGPRLLSANRTTVSRTQTSNLSPLLNISITINYSFANSIWLWRHSDAMLYRYTETGHLLTKQG
jgi:hypothetical protein